MLRVAIQGERGSACDEAAYRLVDDPSSVELLHFADAHHVIRSLAAGESKFAVLAMESPIGTPVQETSHALRGVSNLHEIRELRSEVRHCIMARTGTTARQIRAIASHSIPLQKHCAFLRERFPGYRSIEVADTGLAAKQLSEGFLPPETAVIALSHAATIYGLTVLEDTLPANDGYLTRFAFVGLQQNNVIDATF